VLKTRQDKTRQDNSALHSLLSRCLFCVTKVSTISLTTSDLHCKCSTEYSESYCIRHWSEIWGYHSGADEGSNLPGYVVSIGKWSPTFRNSLLHIPQQFPFSTEMLYEKNRTAVMTSSDKTHCSDDSQWQIALQWWHPVTKRTAVMIASDKTHCSDDSQ